MDQPGQVLEELLGEMREGSVVVGRFEGLASLTWKDREKMKKEG
jgi:hypothetical protein